MILAGITSLFGQQMERVAETHGRQHPVVELPLIWNFFPFNFLFFPISTILNLLFFVDWLIWDWLATAWNMVWGMAILLPNSILFGIVLLIIFIVFVVPLSVIFGLIITIFVLIPLMFVFLALLVFAIVSGFITAAGLWPTFFVLWLFWPFDKLFWIWLLLVIMMISVTNILPTFGIVLLSTL